MVVLDTHVLVWWVSEDEQLSEKAISTIKKNSAAEDSSLLVSSISIWEIATLIQKGRLVLNTDIDSWLAEIMQIQSIRFIPVNNDIGIRSSMLPGNFHKDPADRIIVATARKFSVPLITKDQKIQRYEHVETIW